MNMTLNGARCVALALLSTSMAAAAQTPPPRPRDAEPQLRVIEDDAVRIEESSLRGQTERIVVKPKGALTREYEIVPARRGKDLSQSRDAVGQRVWSLLTF